MVHAGMSHNFRWEEINHKYKQSSNGFGRLAVVTEGEYSRRRIVFFFCHVQCIVAGLNVVLYANTEFLCHALSQTPSGGQWYLQVLYSVVPHGRGGQRHCRVVTRVSPSNDAETATDMHSSRMHNPQVALGRWRLYRHSAGSRELSAIGASPFRLGHIPLPPSRRWINCSHKCWCAKRRSLCRSARPSSPLPPLECFFIKRARSSCADIASPDRH
ncbi:hypothetical protein MRX96_013716 [Rhipicephalus microplus]